jgi:hypothetical protein
VDRYEVKVVEGLHGFHPFLLCYINGHVVDLLPIEEVPPMKSAQDAEELAMVVLWQQLEGATDSSGAPLSVLV